MSGSYYLLNQKYNQLLALIAAGGGGGGGAVSNPMTSDLNAGGYNIVNGDTYSAINMTASSTMTANTMDANLALFTPEINDTTAPYYNDLGSIVPNKYTIATIPVKADAEGSLLCCLRALDLGFKHTVFFSIVAYKDRGTIVILNDDAESDNPIFSQIEYGENQANLTENILTFTCAIPSTKVELAIYQNQQDKGAGVYGSFFVPTVGQQTATIASTWESVDLVLKTVQTSGSLQATANISCNGTATSGVVNTDSLTDRSGVGITLVGTNINASGNNITNANNIETSNLGSPFTSVNLTADLNTNGQIIRSLAPAPNNKVFIENTNLEMLGNDIENVNNISLNVVGGAGNPNILFTAPIDINNNSLINLAAPTLSTDAANKLYVDTTASAAGIQNPMITNLDAGAFSITNIGALSTTASGIINSNYNFLHNYQTGANQFVVGGDIITFNPETYLRITNPNQGVEKFYYDQATSTMSVKSTAVLDCESGSILSTQSGSTTSIGGAMSLNGGDITDVNRITGVPNVDTGMTATGAGSDIVLTTDNENVNIIQSKLFCRDGDINTTNTSASTPATAGSIIITNGVIGRGFDDGLGVVNYAVNEVMDGRNHSFLEGYGNFFTSQELPRQTARGRGSFGVKLRAVVNDAINQFVSVRMMPQAAENPGGIQPEINYSRLTFQGTGAAPAYQNDTLTVAPNQVSTPALQENRFQNGSELFIQIKCVYATTTSPNFYAPLHYTVSFSGVESSGQVCSGSADCAWNGNNTIQNSQFGFEVLTESVGGISIVDNVEMFCDGLVSCF